VANEEGEQQFLGVGDIVVTWNRGNLEVNILGKAGVLHFALTLLYGWEHCQSQPANYLT
jgi:hypothetical protein